MATEPTAQVGTRVLFENERIRVWDLALAPGESLAKHIHRNDYCFIVVSGGLIRTTPRSTTTSSSRTTRSSSGTSRAAKSTTASRISDQRPTATLSSSSRAASGDGCL